MNLWNDNFIDEAEQLLFEEYLGDPSALLLEMASVLGNEVRAECRLPFSFYFSDKNAVHQQHGIRAKIIWNPSKSSSNADGYMELHGDYRYISGSHKYQPTSKELRAAREFFQKYKVLFAAVWEEKLNPMHLVRYFAGDLSLRDLLAKFEEVREKQYYDINHCKTLGELENCVRKNKIFNIND